MHARLSLPHIPATFMKLFFYRPVTLLLLVVVLLPLAVQSEPRTLDVALGFLPEGQRFVAYIYRDDTSVPTSTKVGIERRHVSSKTVLKVSMRKQGGVAIRITPRKAD